MSGYTIAIAFLILFIVGSVVAYIHEFPKNRSTRYKSLYITRSTLMLTLPLSVLLMLISVSVGFVLAAHPLVYFLPLVMVVMLMTTFIDYLLHQEK